jgi:hypothetical protein
MTTDLLSNFVNKEVTVTLRNGTTRTGTIIRNEHGDTYPYKMGTFNYTFDARYFPGENQERDIIGIVETKPKQMNNKQQLLQSIKDTEEQLIKLKEQLEQKAPTIQEAKVGDTLEDGSIVIKKENGLALLIAPKSTEVQCPWSKQFSEVFDKLSSEGFIPSQWFIPTVEQLKLAHKVIPNEFNKDWYWSSSEYNASNACFVIFNNGIQCRSPKSSACCVRSVRCVSY